jgi:hypothetical protein
VAEIPTEALEAAARARFAIDGMPGETWDGITSAEKDAWCADELPVIAAAAPFLVAEGRRQAAADIRAAPEKEARLQSLGLWRSLGEEFFDHAARWFALIAEGNHG